MHPHWYSSSPEVQRKLISLFLRSLESPAPASPLSGHDSTHFESELTFTSPHDVAAVLRWGLRHLKLDTSSFGGSDRDWYKKFALAEQKGNYKAKAFTADLIPLLPNVNAELLVATLEVTSSLAAHSEHIGSSGSRLTKLIGLWLLSGKRTKSSDDFTSFYARWDTTGRILEHLFLARIRYEFITTAVLS